MQQREIRHLVSRESARGVIIIEDWPFVASAIGHGGVSETYTTWEGRSMTAPTNIPVFSTWTPRTGDGPVVGWTAPVRDSRPIRRVERQK